MFPRSRFSRALCVVLGVLPAAALHDAARAQNNFTNTTPIVISDAASGAAAPYPSIINVTGATTNIEEVRVTLSGVSHDDVDNLDILLVSPNGTRVVLMSDWLASDPVTNLFLSFQDEGYEIGNLPTYTGTFRPFNRDGFDADAFPAPAPAGPHAGTLAQLRGTNANGTWTLYVFDDSTSDGGSISGGWSLNFNGFHPPLPPSNTLTYQGRLNTGSGPVEGPADFIFKVWDHPTSNLPSDLEFEVPVNALPVTGGLFTASLTSPNIRDLRNGQFWIEIQVRHPAGSGSFVTLTPRQQLTVAPAAATAYSLTESTGQGGILLSPYRATVAGALVVSPAAYQSAVFELNSLQVVGRFLTNPAKRMWDFRAVGSTSPFMVIDGTFGRINVGASDPESRFQITGGAPLSTAPSSGYITLGGTTSANLVLDNDALQARNNGVAAAFALNPLGGSVSIGNTAAPAATTIFQVGGNAAKPSGGSWAVLSDARAKRDIRPITGALDSLLRLRGVSFEYNLDDPNLPALGRVPGRHVGMLAQDVERVFPDWIDTIGEAPDANAYKTLTFKGFEALTVEALRELHDSAAAREHSLREELRHAQQRNSDLEARIQRMESMLLERK